MNSHRMRRLFFALWPDERCRESLQSAQQRLVLAGKQARYVPAANLHITLHFIGNVSREKLPCFQQQARRLSADHFDLTLDTFGYFKKARVGWMGCTQTPEGLAVLHRLLAGQLTDCGFQAEKRHYNPHVTMIRKLQLPPDKTEAEPINWHVNDFVLMESVSVTRGVRYDILERYPLN